MKKIILPICTLLTLSNAVDIRYGKGSFDMNFAIKGIFNVDKSVDIDTLTIENPHNNIFDSNFYYFYDIDIYSSDYVDTMADMIKIPLDNLPLPVTPPVDDMIDTAESLNSKFKKVTFVKDMVPTPFEVKIKGFDMNIGAGYDIYHDKEGYIGVGVGTGISAPYIYSNNQGMPGFGMMYAMMKSSDTSMMSWKTSLTLQAAYRVWDGFSVGGTALYGYHFGEMDNGWIDSDIDIEGTDTMLNIAFMYDFGSLAEWGKGLTVSAGYTRKSWNMDNADVKLLGGIFEHDFNSNVDANFDSDNLYLGIGYRF